MFDDFKELLSIFNDRKVKYLIVGGYAVSLHAQPRATQDIDLLVKPDAGNAKRGISPEMAVRLSRVFGGSPESWLAQQAEYGLAHVRASRTKLKRLEFA
ncbi:MAG TPA: hypothetical protein VMX16_03050 [Terriglobia bacterium]|nr:hypothetical protein [Terriglobia bacterium]